MYARAHNDMRMLQHGHSHSGIPKTDKVAAAPHLHTVHYQNGVTTLGLYGEPLDPVEKQLDAVDDEGTICGV
jgi:hypothetical protein